jgi:hypothetical protein
MEYAGKCWVRREGAVRFGSRAAQNKANCTLFAVLASCVHARPSSCIAFANVRYRTVSGWIQSVVQYIFNISFS